MDLKILGSSSKGNCYILDNGDEALVLECGIPFKNVREAVNFNTGRIVGAVISHEHGDHSKAVQKFLEAFIPVFTSRGTARALGIEGNNLVTEVADHVMYSVGQFSVLPFPVEHDAAQPFGFLVYHPAMGTMMFATDTRWLRYKPYGLNDIFKFQRLNNILIECNYRHDIMEANIASGKLPKNTARRTEKTHCSFAECRAILLAQDLSEVNNIVLMHLSDGNSNASEFQKDIQEATGKTVTIAESGTTIKNFNKTPF